MNRVRKVLAGCLLALGLAVPVVALAAPEASASNLMNVPHTHLAGCTQDDCWTWILANGAVMRGPTSELVAQYGYVLVVCSQHYGSGWWHVSNLGQWGPYGNDGATHPYCVNPYDAYGVRWNLYPKTKTGL